MLAGGQPEAGQGPQATGYGSSMLREPDPAGPSARGTATAGWEYDVRTLELPVRHGPSSSRTGAATAGSC